MEDKLIVEDVASFEDESTTITVYMERTKDKEYSFLKHIVNKTDNTENITRYSLSSFLKEHYLIEKFVKGNLVRDRNFFKQVMQLKAK